jgi:hypothetical protein
MILSKDIIICQHFISDSYIPGGPTSELRHDPINVDVAGGSTGEIPRDGVVDETVHITRLDVAERLRGQKPNSDNASK